MQRATPGQIQETFRRIGYQANHLSLFHSDRAHRIKLLSGGEGAGKSVGAALEVLSEFPFWNLVYIVGPKYDSARKEFSYIKKALQRLGAVDRKQISEPQHGKCALRTVFGSRVETLSAEDGPDAVTGTGESPDLILMVEAGKQPYEIYLACRGRIARSRGLLILSGTIESSERWYPELITRWQADNPEGAHSFIVPTWANRVLYPGGEADPEILALKAAYPEDRFQERFGAVPCPPSGLVFKEFGFRTHVFDWCRFDPHLDVEIWIDPGYSGSHYDVTAVQFHSRAETRQFLPTLPEVALLDVWAVDEVYASHAIHQEVIAVCQARPWWPQVKSGVGDVVMSTHPMAGRAPLDVWYELAHLNLRGQRVEVEDGIDRHRTFLKDPATGAPRLFFNPACRGALGEYGRWSRKEIGEGTYGEAEKGNCDALKAISYGLVDQFGFIERAKREEKHERELPAMWRILKGR